MTKRKMNIIELVEQLRSEQLLKKDMVVPSSCLSMVGGKIVITNTSGSDALDQLLQSTGLSTGNTLTLDPLDICHVQIASKLGIPAMYYDKLKGEGNVPCLDDNVNHWFRKSLSNYFVRTFVDEKQGTGVIRALLSDKFKVIDNLDVLMASLEGIKESGVRIEVEDADLTDQSMYVRFIAPDITQESDKLLKNYRLPDGSPALNQEICTGFVLSNSETGNGTYTIAPRVKVLACNNGMIISKDSFKRTHLGGKMEEFSEIRWSEGTQEKNLELIISQTKDAVKTFCSQEYLGKVIAKLEESTEPLTHPIDAVKNVCKEFSFSDEKQKGILDFFIKSADLSSFGITQAMTFYAHDRAGADEQYELEKQSVAIVGGDYDKPYTEAKRRTQKGFSVN